MIAGKTGLEERDVILSSGRIEKIGSGLSGNGCSVEIDAQGLLLTYGLADLHVHLREPGNPEKETIMSGSNAAAAGGFTTICAMPNLNPTPDSVDHLQQELDIISASAQVDVRPYAAITIGRKGREIVDIEKLAPLAVGFSDDGSGVQDGGIMREAMCRVEECGSILAAHCEVNELLRNGYIHDGEYCRSHGHRGICSESEWQQIERDLIIASDTGCRYHVCHISTRESVEIIRDAKADGVKVTCETAPHYLTFSDSDLQESGRFKMNPPIRGVADREALREGVADGTIDVIATDHAPHTAEEKSRGLERSLMGVVGLETSFAASYTSLVLGGVVDIKRLVELMSINPRRIFNLPGQLLEGEEANLALFDLNFTQKVDPTRFLTQGRSTPFEGMSLTGWPMLTIYKGSVVADLRNEP